MDYDKFKKEFEAYESYGKSNIMSFGKKDAVNNPAHYTRGGSEAIDVIEDANPGFTLDASSKK